MEYEDLQIICSAYGLFGHIIETCTFSHGEHEGQEGNTNKTDELTVKVDDIPMMG